MEISFSKPSPIGICKRNEKYNEKYKGSEKNVPLLFISLRDRIGVSIDIGTRNFAIYIERFDLTNIKKPPPKVNRLDNSYNCKKVFTDWCDNELFPNGDVIFLDLVDLTGPEKTVDRSLRALVLYLDKFQEIWKYTNYFVIECQMDNIKKRNPKAKAIERFCQAYFYILTKNINKIHGINSWEKPKLLGGYRKKMSKSQIKGWSKNLVPKILRCRKDLNTLSYIESSSKKDDLCDVVAQLTTFKLKLIDKQTKFWAE